MKSVRVLTCARQDNVDLAAKANALFAKWMDESAVPGKYSTPEEAPMSVRICASELFA